MFFKSKKKGLAKAALDSFPQAQDVGSAVVGDTFDRAAQPRATASGA